MNKKDVIYPTMVIRSQTETIELLEQENTQLKEEVDKYKNLIEYIKALNLYEYDLDYDYEENPVDNYYPADMEYHINNWLANEELEKGSDK